MGNLLHKVLVPNLQDQCSRVQLTPKPVVLYYSIPLKNMLIQKPILS